MEGGLMDIEDVLTYFARQLELQTPLDDRSNKPIRIALDETISWMRRGGKTHDCDDTCRLHDKKSKCPNCGYISTHPGYPTLVCPRCLCEFDYTE